MLVEQKQQTSQQYEDKINDISLKQLKLKKDELNLLKKSQSIDFAQKIKDHQEQVKISTELTNQKEKSLISEKELAIRLVNIKERRENKLSQKLEKMKKSNFYAQFSYSDQEKDLSELAKD